MAFRRVRTLRKLSGNPGIRAAYRRALDAMLRDMHEDVSKAILEEYDAAEWRMARNSAWRGSSPRAWGIQRYVFSAAIIVRFIPTGVGKT